MKNSLVRQWISTRGGTGVLALALVAGCDDRGTPTTESTATHTTPNMDGCLTDGSFAFHVYGDGHSEWNDKHVSAAAIENLPDHSQRRPVMKTTTIADGAFSIMCATALRDNDDYPSYALYVDLDGDGRCGAGDVGLAMQLYGWNQAVDDDVGITYTWATYQPTSQLVGAIGAGEAPGTFCHDYFP